MQGMEDVSLILYSRKLDQAFKKYDKAVDVVRQVELFQRRTLAPVGEALQKKAHDLRSQKCHELCLEPMQVIN
jgi:hypothetical protein